MSTTKKNTAPKISKAKKTSHTVVKLNAFGKATLFPVKLSKLNAMLDKSILLEE